MGRQQYIEVNGVEDGINFDGRFRVGKTGIAYYLLGWAAEYVPSIGITFMANKFAEQLLADNDGKFPSYAWPGGYPIFYLAADSGVLCPECANTEQCVKNASDEYPDDNQWRIVATDINYEDASLYCDNCSKRIESAYAESN